MRQELPHIDARKEGGGNGAVRVENYVVRGGHCRPAPRQQDRSHQDLRNESNLDLKDAKDRVEVYLRTQPAMMAGLAAAQKQSAQRALWWLEVVVGGVGLAYMLLNKT